jgi:hypothetical protein
MYGLCSSLQDLHPLLLLEPSTDETSIIQVKLQAETKMERDSLLLKIAQ